MNNGREGLRRLAAIFICMSLLAWLALPVLGGAEESTAELLEAFTLRHGDRSVKKVAITIDDCYKNRRENILKDVELCRTYGVRMTFFPIDYTGCMTENYREIWQAVLDAGCEIGTHSYSHLHIGKRDNLGILRALGRWQEDLDKTLGYHYETRWFRPPYGSVEDTRSGKGNARVVKLIKRYGFEHVVCWDVSENDPDKAMTKIQNGSICLFHAIAKDTKCLEKLIPALLEEGYELVTVSELFGFDPPETGGDLYVFNKADYEGK